jgi:hypothetical protein
MDLLSLLVSTEQRIRLGSKPTFTVFFVSRVLYFNREKKKIYSCDSKYLSYGWAVDKTEFEDFDDKHLFFLGLMTLRSRTVAVARRSACRSSHWWTNCWTKKF